MDANRIAWVPMAQRSNAARRRAMRWFTPVGLGSLAMLAGACAQQPPPPKQVDASNPSVTYTYQGDQGLIDANQNAMTYCLKYQSVARTARLDDAAGDARTVVFECLPTIQATVPPPLNTKTAYSYRTDQELLDASRNAEIYCRQNGPGRAVTTAVVNADGTKALSFRCVAL